MGTLTLLLIFVLIFLPGFKAQSPSSLDALLQDYAYRAFIRPRTGIIYQADPPSNLTDVKVAAVRLRNGSLKKRGFPALHEFKIPEDIVVIPYVARLVVVYQNLGSLSSSYYPLHGFNYLAPVLGLLAYSAANLSARNLPQLQIISSGDPIFINFSQIANSSTGLVPKCVFFNSSGFPHFSNPTSGKICSATQAGHFSLVVKAPKKSIKKKVAIIVGSSVGGVLFLLLLGFFIWWLHNLRKKNKLQKMEKAAEMGETLHMVTIGGTRTPSAMVSRTQPILENEHAPIS